MLMRGRFSVMSKRGMNNVNARSNIAIKPYNDTILVHKLAYQKIKIAHNIL